MIAEQNVALLFLAICDVGIAASASFLAIALKREVCTWWKGSESLG